jgi:hypothetical protein
MTFHSDMLPSVRDNLVADEFLPELVQAQCNCPSCGHVFNKSFFADGDSEACVNCGAALWFELRGEQVHAHPVNPKPQGTSLSELLRGRQLPSA